MKKILTIVGVVALGIGAAFLLTRDSKNDEDAAFAFYSGNIEIRRVNLSFRVPGRLAEILLDEGDDAKQGDAIAILDRDLFQAELDAAQASLEEARAAREQALATRDQTKATLERLENGARPQELEEARALVAEYEANLQRAESELQRDRKLLQTRAVSESAYETAVETVGVVRARLARSKEALSLLEEGTRREDLDAANAALAQAEAAVVKADAAVEKAASGAVKAQISLDDATLRAPNDGIVLTRVAEPGAIVAAGQTVAVLSRRDEIWAYVYLEEADLGSIRPGAPAEISTDSSDKIYAGRVGSVSPEAEFTPKTVETKSLRANLVYRARILVDEPDDGLRQGAPVDVKIQRRFERATRDDDRNDGDGKE